MSRQAYVTDVNDAEWERMKPGLPKERSGKRGRPRRHTIREIVNAIFYLVTAGGVWRLLPHDLPPWKTVYHYFRAWSRDGTLERLHTRLREEVRTQATRNPTPSAAILDSQSVKTTEIGGAERGYDAGKKVKGRKRHLLVDTVGLILLVVVHAASLQDRDGAKLLLEQARSRFPRLQRIWADGGYAGQLVDWVKATCNWALDIVKRSADLTGFHVLPRRWVVERTFGWLNSSRRLSKDYEYLPRHSETFIYTAMIRLMVKRLTRA